MNRLFLLISLLVLGCATTPKGTKTDSDDGEHEMHSHHGEHEDHHAGVDSSKAVPNGEAKIGDVTICPISKKPFVVSDSSPVVEHEGRTYYMCCGHCSEKFKANPTAYL